MFLAMEFGILGDSGWYVNGEPRLARLYALCESSTIVLLDEACW